MTATHPPLTLCLINFNGAEHLRKAFAALEEQDWKFSEILVVDNASVDDSVALVEQLCPEARLIPLNENRGPGAARNAGFASAKNDLILFHDNDVLLNAGTASRLVDCLMKRQQRGGLHREPLAVAPRVLYAEDADTIQFDSADCHFLGLMSTRNADTAAADSVMTARGLTATETTSLVTACFLMNRTVWRGSAPFDEHLGFNLEDHDFGVRACVAGYSLWIEPSATVLHGSGTPGLSYRPGSRPSEERIFYLVRNRWIVIGKCYAMRTLILLAPALLFYELLQLTWLLRRRQGHVWWRALRAFTRGRRGMYAMRRDIQRERRESDAQILRDGPLPVTRSVREEAPERLLQLTERLLRGYWHLVRNRV